MLDIGNKEIQNSINTLIDYSIDRGLGDYIEENRYTVFVTLWTDKDYQIELRIGTADNCIRKFIYKNGELISELNTKVNLND